MRRDHQVVALHLEVRHLHVGKIQPQRLPRGTVVERHVDAMLGAGIEQSATDRILANHVCEIAAWDLRVDARPGRAVVVRAIEVRLTVPHLIALRGNKGTARRVRGGVDDADPRVDGQSRRRHELPGLSAVLRHVHETIVRSRPDRVPFQTRRGESEHRPIHLGSVFVKDDGPARIAERLLICPGQVRTDPLPRLPFVGGSPDMLRSHVEIVRCQRRKDDRVGPVPALRHRARRFPHDDSRPRLAIAELPRPPIEARQSVRRSGEEDVRLRGMRCHPTALAAADLVRERRILTDGRHHH